MRSLLALFFSAEYDSSLNSSGSTSLQYTVIFYHLSTMLYSHVRLQRAEGTSPEDEAAMISSARSLLQVLSTNVDVRAQATLMPRPVLMVRPPNLILTLTRVLTVSSHL